MLINNWTICFCSLQRHEHAEMWVWTLCFGRNIVGCWRVDWRRYWRFNWILWPDKSVLGDSRQVAGAKIQYGRGKFTDLTLGRWLMASPTGFLRRINLHRRWMHSGVASPSRPYQLQSRHTRVHISLEDANCAMSNGRFDSRPLSLCRRRQFITSRSAEKCRALLVWRR